SQPIFLPDSSIQVTFAGIPLASPLVDSRIANHFRRLQLPRYHLDRFNRINLLLHLSAGYVSHLALYPNSLRASRGGGDFWARPPFHFCTDGARAAAGSPSPSTSIVNGRQYAKPSSTAKTKIAPHNRIEPRSSRVISRESVIPRAPQRKGAARGIG